MKLDRIDISKEFNPGFSHHFYYMRRGLLAAITKHASSLSGVLLDFGCGSKPYRPIIKVDKYIGLDFENPGHNHANEDIDVYYDGKSIPFADNYFDSVLCSEVFEHLFDLESTLKELNRVLKKGGKMLVTCPFVWGEHEMPYDYARYTVFALQDLFKKNGFQVIEFEKQGKFIEAITQMKALYFSQAYGPFLSRLSFVGNFIRNSFLFMINGWGSLKSKILPSANNLYLSNVFLVEKK
ncbi:MAG: methyltransferase domain-containing protein [Chitinophagaceae bacterium]